MISFLMIGQSNMAGRGDPRDVEAIANKRLYVMRNGRWVELFVPVNCDRPFSGVSLAESFADCCSKEFGVDVGLIPCADGGTAIEQWKPGSLLYDHAVFQAKLAMRTTTLAGILWHQGESDCDAQRNAVYEEKCSQMFASLRNDLGLPELPILVGGLGDFLVDCDGGTFADYPKINTALQQIAQKLPNVRFVSAEGLAGKDDNLHFNAKALRTFGERYFEAFRTMPLTLSEQDRVVFDGNYSAIERL